MLLVLDNRDSFTYNLVQAFEILGASCEVRCSSEICPEAICLEAFRADRFKALVMGPGPGALDSGDINVKLARALSGKIPILGVCLGHQAIGLAFGMKLVPARRLLHGTPAAIFGLRGPLFDGMDEGLAMVRYNSLSLEPDSLPAELRLTSKDSAGDIMALEHRSHRTYGVQFHPESIGSPAGLQILKNFLKISNCP